MNAPLIGKTIAILLADGFCEEQYSCTRSFLLGAGARVLVVSPAEERVRGWDERHWGELEEVDVPLRNMHAANCDALAIPGGLFHADTLRQHTAVQTLVAACLTVGKPVAAMGHGPQVLIDGGLARNRRLTSERSLRVDFLNAGAWWVNEAAVVDRGLLTARHSADLLLFNVAFLEMVGAADAMERKSYPSATPAYRDTTIPADELLVEVTHARAPLS